MKKGADVVVEALKAPVLGTDRTVTYTKKGKTIIETTRFQVRTWEVILGGLVIWFAVGAPLPNGKSFFSFDPFGILGPNFDPLALNPFNLKL